MFASDMDKVSQIVRLKLFSSWISEQAIKMGFLYPFINNMSIFFIITVKLQDTKAKFHAQDDFDRINIDIVLASQWWQDLQHQSIMVKDVV